ncbi:DMT family transporter [Hyphomonas sp.]|uniref:DMT family transporter n=1 Tax=Hyphomonas sp. TaxID=87 RepID=UPI003D296E5A|tara:strand:+ start:200 stop:1111 length:912 start_codon:yes stop_codon:yes gene_type:complete
MIARLLSAPLLIVVLAIGMGSGIDALVKGTAPEAGLMQLVAWRFLFGAMIAAAVFLAQRRAMPRGEAIRFHAMRGVVQLVSAILFFFALTRLALAEATIIGFTAALMVPFVARVVLGEAVSLRAFAITLVGFAGAAFAVSGGTGTGGDDGRWLGVAAGFTSAMLYAVVLVLLRLRAVREDATTIALFTNAVPALCMSPVLFGLAGPVDMADMPVFALLGALGYSVWYLMTLAYARARAQLLAPIEYTALIWSAVFGIVFFAEIPGWQVWVGAVAIIGSCLGIAFEDHFATRRATRLPVSDIPE